MFHTPTRSLLLRAVLSLALAVAGCRGQADKPAVLTEEQTEVAAAVTAPLCGSSPKEFQVTWMSESLEAPEKKKKQFPHKDLRVHAVSFTCVNKFGTLKGKKVLILVGRNPQVGKFMVLEEYTSADRVKRELGEEWYLTFRPADPQLQASNAGK